LRLEEERLKKRRFVFYLGIPILLILISGSIGRSMGWNQAMEKQTKEQKLSDTFTEKEVISFLTAFYTFDHSGDNFTKYQPFLTRKKAEKEEALLERQDTRPKQVGYAQYQSSQNYVRILNEHSIVVFSFVKLTLDLLNNEGEVSAKDIESQLTLKIHYIYDKKAHRYRINSWKSMDTE